jgi:hypothetical protein
MEEIMASYTNHSLSTLCFQIVLVLTIFSANSYAETRDILAVSFEYSADSPTGSFYAYRDELPPERANRLLRSVAKMGIANGLKVLLPLSHLKKWVDLREERQNRPGTYQYSFKPTSVGALELKALRSTIAHTAIDWTEWNEYKKGLNEYKRMNEGAYPGYEYNELIIEEWKPGDIEVYDDTKQVNADAILTLSIKYYTRVYYQSGLASPIEAMDALAILTWRGSNVPLNLDQNNRRGLVKSSSDGLKGTYFIPEWKDKYYGGISQADNINQDLLDALTLALKSLDEKRSTKAGKDKRQPVSP